MYGKFGDGLDTEVKTAKKIGVVDVYKVAHHGYTTYQNDTTALSYLNPIYAIFTNMPSHEQPKEVVSRLKSVASNYKKSYFVGSGNLIMTIKEGGELTFSQ